MTTNALQTLHILSNFIHKILWTIKGKQQTDFSLKNAIVFNKCLQNDVQSGK